jgi:EmrB/QacA subfamily drug resistance transporter
MRPPPNGIPATLASHPAARQAAEAAAHELSWVNRYVVLTIVCVGVFMTTLDTGIIDVLNPVFTSQFHLNLYVEYWIELSYAIPLIGMLLPAGHLGDRLGRKNVFLTGMILFGGGSGLLTLMPTFETMFLARVIEGIGAACISANGGVLAVSVFPWNQRGQVLGIIGTAVALGLKFGPVVGGALADNFGWRSAFLINVAIGITFVIIGSSVVPTSRRIPGRSFDVWGALLFMVAMGCLLVIINQAPTLGWTSPQVLGLTAGLIVFGAAFAWVSTHVADPTIDLRLYRIRNFSVSVGAAFISFLALTPVNHLLPFYMENVQGLAISETGLLFITTTIAIAVTQPFSGRLADRIGSRPVASVGLMLEGVGLLSLAFIPLHMNPDWLVPELVVVGVGVGLFRSPNHRALFGAVPRDKMGHAGGYQHLPRQLGESIGETGVVTMFSAIVLASAAVAGIHVALPQAAVAAQPTPQPVVQAAPAGVARPPSVIQPYAPAVRSSAAPGTTTVDSNTADDTIIDVVDDSQAGSAGGGLSQAVTSLPADVQMLGYRLMWGLAGLIALGGAAISWFMREDEDLESPLPLGEAARSASEGGASARKPPSPQPSPPGRGSLVSR